MIKTQDSEKSTKKGEQKTINKINLPNVPATNNANKTEATNFILFLKQKVKKNDKQKFLISMNESNK